MNKFEIEHRPNYFGKHTLVKMLKGYGKAYFFFTILFIVSFGLYFFSKMYMGMPIPYTRFITQVALFGILIGPFIPLISYLQRNKKFPSYGLKKDGFLLNERGWDAAFFTWGEIKDVKEYQDPKFGRELHFEFVSFTKAINKDGQDKFVQALNREYVTEKQPKRISTQLVKGDISEFINLFKKYYNEYKEKNPISSFEAYEIATTYIKSLSLPFQISSIEYTFIESIKELDGSFFSFPVKEMEMYDVLVSTAKQEVEGIRSEKQIDYPHKATNLLTKEEAIDIVKKHLGDKMKQMKIKYAHFYFSGIYEYPKPSWIVYVKNNKSTMEGARNTDYIIDSKTKEIVDSIMT